MGVIWSVSTPGPTSRLVSRYTAFRMYFSLSLAFNDATCHVLVNPVAEIECQCSKSSRPTSALERGSANLPVSAFTLLFAAGSTAKAKAIARP